MSERLDPREPFLEGYDCPDCGGIFAMGACQSCGLDIQDLEAAADYFDSLDDQPDEFTDYY